MINLKQAFRAIFKSPFVSGVAILSLALGIGANSAIFSLFNEMLLRPLPVVHPEQLVNFASPGPQFGSNSCGQPGDCDEVFSYPMLQDLQKANTGFSGIGAHVPFGANVAYNGVTVNGDGLQISGSYFPVLGVKPELGRLIGPQDDTPPGQNFVAVVSYGFWISQLGGDRSIVGKNIVVNGKPFNVIGVGPRDFEGTTLGMTPYVFVPMSMRDAMQTGNDKDLTNRRSYWAYLFGRLKPGMSMTQAKASVNAVYTPILSQVEAPLQKGMSDSTMRRFKAKLITLADGRRGQSSLHKETKTPILLLMCITGIVLLIACANIANLLLASGAGRSMEMAVRLSLGATRGQILAQLLTESVLLGLIGGVASLFVAKGTLVGMTELMPSNVVEGLTFALDGSAVAFAAALSVTTGFLFGLFPAVHSTRAEIASVMREGGTKQTGAKAASRFRTSLVTAQIALSMALLVSAGLFVKSLRNVSSVDLGVKIDHVTTFRIAPVLNGYTGPRSAILFQQVTEALGAIPGVTGVTTGRVPLMGNSNWGNGVRVQGYPHDPDTDLNSRFNAVGPAYFKVTGVPLVAGREFTEADALGRPKVVIVNETFAKKFNLGRDAVGKRMSQGGDTLDMEIIGLAKDSKYSDVKAKTPPVYVIPYRQDSTVGSLSFYVRSGIDPSAIVRAVPGVIHKFDPDLPVVGLRTLEQQVKDNVFLDRMISTLSAAFATLATLLAAIGLYGVLAYSVTQRTREIGVRMALGANGGSVQVMVLKQVALMTLIGGVVGIAGALALGTAAKALLFELKGYDPVVMGASVVVLAAVAFGAGYVPALRASRIDPMQSLRHE
ncbi:MAG: ABC transporter permease [Gemmatimonadaceae bacterium]